MAVADAPGQAGKLCRGRGPNVGNRLLRSPHRNHAAIIEQKAIAVAQDRRPGHVQQKRLAIQVAQDDAAAIAVMEEKPARWPPVGGFPNFPCPEWFPRAA